MAGKKGSKGARPIVIRREDVVQGGHHGGAWKVAYADFVTAMMAFFLLMWLINATTEKQRRGLADYFSPAGPKTRAMSGEGKPFGGLTPLEVGALVSNRGFISNTDQTGRPPPAEQPVLDQPPVNRQAAAAAGQVSGKSGASNQVGVARFAAPQTDVDAVPIEGDSNQSGASGRSDATEDSDTESGGGPAGPDSDVPARAADTQGPVGTPVPSPQAPPTARDAANTSRIPAPPTPNQDHVAARFRQAAAELRRALAADPAIGDAARQVGIDVTADELRIQIFDAEGKPMFDPGSAEPNSRARQILDEVAPVLARLGEPISIVGHTDASTCAGGCRSNWDLSAARADATRATLVAAGLSDRRVAGVAGLADHDLLLPAQPDAPANRRVVMIVHRPLPVPGAAPIDAAP